MFEVVDATPRPFELEPAPRALAVTLQLLELFQEKLFARWISNGFPNVPGIVRIGGPPADQETPTLPVSPKLFW